MVAKPLMILSARLYCLTAAMMPIGSETTMVTMSATPISSHRRREPIEDHVADRLARVERVAPGRLVPQNWKNAVSHLKYCSQSGRSSP